MSWQHLLREGIRELELPGAVDYTELGRSLVRLDVNEGALQPDPDELAELQRELAKLDLTRYPDASGKAVRVQLASRWNVHPDQILLGNGSVETLGVLLTAFGAPRGGVPAKLLHPVPSWEQYDAMASAYGLTVVPVQLGRNFELDESRMAAAIDREQPSLVVCSSPNNPSGNLFPQPTLERLAERLDGVFVVDEAYADFADVSLIPTIGKVPGLFVMRSLSKIGLAGLRIGALVGEPAAIAELDKVRPPYNLNAVSLALASRLLAHPSALASRISAIVRLRRSLERELRRLSGVTVFPSEANFVLIRTPYDAHAVFHRLLARGVRVRAFAKNPRLERCLRITAGIPLDNARCVHALGEVLDELGRQPHFARSRSASTGDETP